MITAAILDALLARPRSTVLENDMAAALSALRIQLFGPVTAPPPAPPPSAPPPTGGVPLEWNPVANGQRTHIAGRKPSDAVTLVFTTPNTPGKKHQISGTFEGGAAQNNKEWTLTDAAGGILFRKYGQNVTETVVIGPQQQTVIPGGAVMVGAYGLAPSANYYLTVRNVNKDGTGSYVGETRPPDFFVVLNNA